ncbi:RagB/SusD family nutrient uptake outer membrane protein [Aquimarina sp. U1-2]|uniref:RagB/SusD family nutrient uptake outer membrane protein n=1 Tax=Aquimarina sp. U1-2 TaxID=2823141 RepID=UPI001AECFDCC|nr:RagB/SusD family nutrient uptake outer membrane protein [Aquimarina sp. U1-2]MBP2833260.1 RagB/SusD family nutrient uptake outer membrane protein [Aquimarina sp. U1-2]
MKFTINKFIFNVLCFASILLAASCTFDEQENPNAPALEEILDNASVSELNNLVSGIEATMRTGLGIQTTGSGTMARELYLFDADPRNTSDLLGEDGEDLDNNSFYTTQPFNARYVCIKNANILMEALMNTESVTEQEKEGYRGFAKTIIAYELIEVLKSYGQARVDVTDQNDLGPFLDFDQAIIEVVRILDEGLVHLENSGNIFRFPLAGFANFDTPDTFVQFNRATRAIASLYAGNYSDVITDLENSFFDLNGNIFLGVQHVFSLGPGDITNDLFKTPEQSGDQIIVHNSWINEADAGDIRVSRKARRRVVSEAKDNLNGTHETALYEENTSPIDIIRNEELILVYAEAKIRTNELADALEALNIIRDKSGGLPAYDGVQTSEALTAELLKQRRYSLWCENHRMFDLRRYDLSDTLPIDREGDQIFNVLPIPFSENVNQ